MCCPRWTSCDLRSPVQGGERLSQCSPHGATRRKLLPGAESRPPYAPDRHRVLTVDLLHRLNVSIQLRVSIQIRRAGPLQHIARAGRGGSSDGGYSQHEYAGPQLDI